MLPAAILQPVHIHPTRSPLLFPCRTFEKEAEGQLPYIVQRGESHCSRWEPFFEIRENDLKKNLRYHPNNEAMVP